MKQFLILVNDEENIEIVKNRLSQIGEFIIFFDKNFLFDTNLGSSQEVYRQIEKSDQFDVVIIEIESIHSGLYWGFANKELWKWMKEREQ